MEEGEQDDSWVKMVAYLPYFRYALRTFKDCEFCEWIVVCKTLITVYSLHN